MNYRIILKNLGFVLIVEAASMLPPLFVSLIYQQHDTVSFLITISILLAIGLAFYKVKVINNNLYARDGFVIVSLSWILISLFGSLPFMISGSIPSFVDAFFETVSGFTTTGSTILKEVESLPKGILLWRSFTHWVGGMGVLVLMLAVMPSVKGYDLHIMKAESPGPSPGKIVPKIAQTAKILYVIYIVLTLILIILLVIAGMPLYDSLIHAFGTAGTGGFSSRNLSVGAYNNVYVDIILTVFMLIFGVNFSLYYQGIKGNLKAIFKDAEFRFYLGAFLFSVTIITINTLGPIFNNVGDALRHASFQVSTIMTTTGYSTVDFNLWPTLSKAILVLLMFMGASAGSTAGGIKCIRIVLLLKIIKREIIKIIHPRSVYTVKINKKAVDENTLSGVMAFFFAFIAIFVVSVIIVTFEGKDLVTSFTAVSATIGNVGPGLGIVGPMGNFSEFSVLSKIVFSFCMLAGRLEIFPILVLLLPSTWKRVNI